MAEKFLTTLVLTAFLAASTAVQAQADASFEDECDDNETTEQTDDDCPVPPFFTSLGGLGAAESGALAIGVGVLGIALASGSGAGGGDDTSVTTPDN